MTNKVIRTYISLKNGEILNIVHDIIKNNYLFIDGNSNISYSKNLDEIISYIDKNYKEFINIDNTDNYNNLLDKYNNELSKIMSNTFHEINNNLISKVKYVNHNGNIKYITGRIIKNNILEAIRLNGIDLIDLTIKNNNIQLLDMKNKYYITSLLSDIIYNLN